MALIIYLHFRYQAQPLLSLADSNLWPYQIAVLSLFFIAIQIDISVCIFKLACNSLDMSLGLSPYAG